MAAATMEQILLVDDEPQILVALEDLLCGQFIVFKASSPTEALHMMEEEANIAVVVTDQRMPEMCGDELVARINKFHHAQRILVTGYADLGAVMRAVNDGRIFAYVTKPWEAEDLRLKVERAAEQFRLSQDLESEKRLLDDLMSNSPDGIYFKDVDLRFVRANPTIARWLGRNVDELVGKRLPELLATAEAREIEAAERASLASGSPMVGVVRKELQGSTPRYFSETKAPIVDPEGKPVGLVAISRETTRQHELEQQLLQAQKMEAVGRLAGGVAHDFNNLLLVIQGYGELLKESFADADPRHEDAAQLLNATDRAAALTKQLLLFSSKRPTRAGILDLKSVTAELVTMLRRLVHENIRIQVDLEAELGFLRGDRTQVEQVVLNLAINARDAMPEGGTLTIRTEHVERQVGSRATPTPHSCLIVEDTGTGMSSEIRERIFEPFFSTKEVGKGTGLGLSTVYGIVRQMGGDISVDSELGRGTSFCVVFPETQDDAEEVRLPEREPTPALGTETILVVEDDQAVRRVTVRILVGQGYKVLEASSPSEARRVLSEVQPVDLVITDVGLPEVDGLELGRQLMASYPELRILYMSGYVPSAEGEADPFLGKHHLDKPFSPEKLNIAVRKVFSEE